MAKAKYIGDEYRIRKSLSDNGSMSSVYYCTDDDDNEYAVKLYDKFPGDKDNQKLQELIFQREVETLKKVQHPNIVKFVAFDIDDDLDKYYIVLEYINGKNLAEARDMVSSYTEYKKLELADQILLGVEYLHKKGVMHRDLKPSNIMIDEEGKIKIIDFGISKGIDTHYTDLTVYQFNTPKYCSPEQEENKEITFRSDIYSLGLILYELFSGEIVDKEKPFNNSLLSEGIENILSRMLKKRPEARYGDITEIRSDIQLLKNRINQEKYVAVIITKKVASMLKKYDYIKRDDVLYAAKAVNEELSGKNYIISGQSNEGEYSYQILGRQLIFICKRHRENQEKLIITTVRTINAAAVIELKEMAYEIPYSIKATNTSVRRSSNEISASTLLDELMLFEIEYDKNKNASLNTKSIINKWTEILKLERQQLDQSKARVGYKNITIHDDYIEVELYKNIPSEDLKFEPDDMLQMTAKGQKNRDYNVGYLKDYYGGVLTIELAADTDVENIASFGDVSINRRMAEIALNRQEQALKSIRFRENANPTISDIVFEPSLAKSKNNELLTLKDCHSEYIDPPKLVGLNKALAAEDIFLLQGPPGTGKTTFISELVCQILDRKPDSKILIASQSHVAVDHSLKKIKELDPDIKLIRIGLREKISESVREYTLDSFCKEWTQQVIRQCQEAIENYKQEIGLDNSLQEKNTIVHEIEKLMDNVSLTIDEMAEVEDELAKTALLSEKWAHVNDVIKKMKSLVKTETNNVPYEKLLDLVTNFVSDLDGLNVRLGIVLEESIQISTRQAELENRYSILDKKMERDQADISDWKEMLGISNDPKEYETFKDDLQKETSQNQEKYNRFSKIDSLCKDWIKRVQQGDGLLQESLIDATIVGATCLGIASLSDKIDLKFDCVIVDEAGKATPTEILVPISLGKKVILVGDHKQLPPVVDEALLDVSSQELTREDLETSLFEYLEKSLSKECKSVLDQQYRMHPVIGDLISTLFYQETPLISKTTKEEKTIPLNIFNNKALVWLSTTRRKNNKEEYLVSTYQNQCEAKIIFEYLQKIDVELGVQNLKKEVAIIAGYKAQKDLLRRMYTTQYASVFNNITVEINTVDAFQGRETDIVFYSVVRSNERGNLGFLKDVRRLNVAFSRARELLVVVGNHNSVTKRLKIDDQPNPFIGILEYILMNDEGCSLEEV